MELVEKDFVLFGSFLLDRNSIAIAALQGDDRKSAKVTLLNEKTYTVNCDSEYEAKQLINFLALNVGARFKQPADSPIFRRIQEISFEFDELRREFIALRKQNTLVFREIKFLRKQLKIKSVKEIDKKVVGCA